jgi:hypothetical protein
VLTSADANSAGADNGVIDEMLPAGEPTSIDSSVGALSATRLSIAAVAIAGESTG